MKYFSRLLYCLVASSISISGSDKEVIHIVGYSSPYTYEVLECVDDKRDLSKIGSTKYIHNNNSDVRLLNQNRFFMSYKMSFLTGSNKSILENINRSTLSDQRFGMRESVLSSDTYDIIVGFDSCVNTNVISDTDESKDKIKFFLNKASTISFYTTWFYHGYWGSAINYSIVTGGISLNSEKTPVIIDDKLLELGYREKSYDRLSSLFFDACMVSIISKRASIYLGSSMVVIENMNIFSPIVGIKLDLDPIDVYMIYPSKIGIVYSARKIVADIGISFRELPLKASRVSKSKDNKDNDEFKGPLLLVEEIRPLKVSCSLSITGKKHYIQIGADVDISRSINITPDNILTREALVELGLMTSFSISMYISG